MIAEMIKMSTTQVRTTNTDINKMLHVLQLKIFHIMTASGETRVLPVSV